ncbi:ABC transporter permease [Limibacillus halophilus]
MNALLKLIAQRLALGLLILFIVSVIIAFIVELLPGDTCQELMGQAATPDTLEVCREEMGLNKPAYERYFDWLGGMLTGDMGRSLATNREISELVASRIGNTLFLAGFAALMAVPLSLVLGMLAALYRNSFFDRAVNVFTLSSISFPEFFVAYLLIYFFASRLGWFPGISNVSSPDIGLGERLYRTILPAVTLTLVVTAHMMRMTRASIINLLASPYIEMARLKGITPSRVIFKHALPNAWAPIINVVALNLAYLIVGVVVVEVVFVYPGLGQLLVDAVSKRDMPMVQAGSMIFAAVYILLNLSADVLAIVTNPRLLHPR